MWQTLKSRGCPTSYLQVILDTKAKDKNNFARGLFGKDRYITLGLKEFDLNKLTKE